MTYIYPIILSLLPALHLYINNRVPIRYAYPTWIAIAIFIGVIVLIFTKIMKSPEIAGIIASIFSIVIFYFEIILRVIGTVLFDYGITPARIDVHYGIVLPLIIFGVWILLWINAFRLIIRSDSVVQKLNIFLIVVSLILVISPVISIGKILENNIENRNTFNSSLRNNQVMDLPELNGTLGGGDDTTRPDIYYLIFDAFAGQKILSMYYDTDINNFINQLDNRGFYVATESKTNYSQTICSLPSTLNLTYLDDITQSIKDEGSWDPLAHILKNNLVSSFLAKNGYELITLSSGFWPTEEIRTNRKYSPSLNLNEYQEVLLVNTPAIRIYPDILFDHHRNRIKFSLEKLANIESGERPKLIISHIYSPHPPFVFDENGNHIRPPRQFSKFDADGFRLMGGTTAEYQEMYSGQLDYIFDQIILLIDEIQAETKSPPIIIIQGDHGPGSMVTQYSLEKTNLQERFSIMNAYYFPDQDYTSLYPEITPVNSFRIVLNQYFDTDFDLLPDRNIFSPFHRPYQFTDVTEMLE